ncbi:hypothetical protein Q4485_15500 [Granulosicoccaceae sp. 1_MG-2023]|nr:hypothetical protein [Granulosicoccaceae sp. 1_MG-2023]
MDFPHSPAGTPVLRCEGLCADEGGEALTVELAAGESLQLQAASKHSERVCLELLAGRRRPCLHQAARLALDGRDMLGLSAFDYSRCGVQLVAASPPPIAGLSVRQNLDLSAGAGAAFEVAEVLQRLPALAALAGLDGEALPRRVHAELALARVLVRPLRLLLMAAGALPQTLARELAGRGVAMIFGGSARPPAGISRIKVSLEPLSRP